MLFSAILCKLHCFAENWKSKNVVSNPKGNLSKVAKEYTMKSLFRVMLKNPDDFNAIFIAMGTRCLITQ